MWECSCGLALTPKPRPHHALYAVFVMQAVAAFIEREHEFRFLAGEQGSWVWRACECAGLLPLCCTQLSMLLALTPDPTATLCFLLTQCRLLTWMGSCCPSER